MEGIVGIFGVTLQGFCVFGYGLKDLLEVRYQNCS